MAERLALARYMNKNIKEATYAQGGRDRRAQNIYSTSKFIYKSQIGGFLKWREASGLPKNTSVEKALGEARLYIEHLRDLGRSEHSVNTAISAISKGLGVDQRAVGKADRSGGSTKGRSGRVYRNEMNARLVDAARCIGIRYAEYASLRGRDLIERDGRLFVVVEQGKGGKRQEQLILKSHEGAVRELFRGVAPEQRVFADKEIRSAQHANLHAVRREVAQEAYKHYKELLKDSVERERMKEQLRDRFGQNPARMGRFDADRMDRPYIVRSPELRKELEKGGFGKELDRLALTATSVFHLAHYRAEIVVKSYLR